MGVKLSYGCFVFLLLLGTPLAAQLPIAEEVLQAQLDRSVALDLYPSVQVAWVDLAGVRYWQAGELSPEAGVPRPDTIYALGPATGVFTAAATGLLVKDKQIAWHSKLASLLPASASPPEFAGQPILLQHLATHTSGLPPIPLDLPAREVSQPFADYSEQRLYRLLAVIQELNERPGTRYQYSPLGLGILGHALERRTGKPFDTLMRETLTDPLALPDTVAVLSDEQLTRLAPGFEGQMQVEPLRYNALAGGGALKSTAADLVRWLQLCLPLTRVPHTDVLQQIQNPSMPSSVEDTWAAMGWHVTTRASAPVVWASGQDRGHAVFIGMVPQERKGVVVLANSSASVDDIGFHLLQPQAFPWRELPQVLPLSTFQQQAFPGVYETVGGRRVIVTVEDEHLFVEVPGAPRYRVYPLERYVFGYAKGDAQVRFSRSAVPSPSLTLVQGQDTVPARRIEPTP